MTFKFAPIESFTAPVTIMTPGGETQDFSATFRYFDNKAHAEMAAKPIDEVCRMIWTGWSGIEAPDPADAAKSVPLAFSEEQRDLLLTHAYIGNAVYSAYLRAREGLRSKN